MSGFIRPVIRPWRSAFRYLREQSHEQPVFFWSVILGTLGPVTLIAVPPLREKMGCKRRAEIPTSYPVPHRPRQALTGYGDP
ncbi:hypothetical protein M422DRAFT_222658 [Sphaerobolus stellatus SS14]|nr:hypothetical protein M422DRAFT_222658 [Sphaerobolus stellatus SS14]